MSMDDIIFKNINELLQANVYSIYDQIMNLELTVTKLRKLKNTYVDLQVVWNLNEVHFIDTSKLQSINLSKLINSVSCDNNKYFVTGKTLDLFDVFSAESVEETYEIITYDKTCYEKIKKSLDNCQNNITLNDNIYDSYIDILLDIPDMTKRFGFDANSKSYYGTSMFYTNLFILCFKNMIPNIHISSDFETKNMVHKIVSGIDYDKLKKYENDGKIEINEIYQNLDNGLTPVELALYIYKHNSNHLLKTNLTNIIILLSKYTYMRPPILYARYLELTELFSVLENIKCSYNIATNEYFYKTKIKSDVMKCINTFVIEQILKSNCDSTKYVEYIGFDDIEYLMNINCEHSQIKSLLTNINDKLTERDRNDLILHYNCVDIYNKIANYDHQYLKHIVPQLIENANFISLLYIMKTQHDIRPYIHFKNIVKMITKSHINLIKFYKLCEKYDINICVMTDDKQNNLLHYIALNKPGLLMDIELNRFDTNIMKSNIDGDTFLHILCRNKMIKIIEHTLQNFDVAKNNINITNKKGETMLLIAAITKQEELYNILKKYKADDSITDIIGNSVYHYICMNNMFVDSKIKLVKNKYGYTPFDYTHLKSYYY